MTTVDPRALSPLPSSLPHAARPANVALIGVAAMVIGASVAALAVHIAGGGPRAQLVMSTFVSAAVAVAATVGANRRFGVDAAMVTWRPLDIALGGAAAVAAVGAAFAVVAGARAALIPVDWPLAAGGGDYFLALALLRVGVVPVAEELLFRGVLMRSLCELLGVRSGIVVQAVIFAIAHVRVFGGPSGAHVLAAFGAGIVFGIVTAATKRLAPAVIAHALVNAL